MSQPKNYTALVSRLKEEIRSARIKASLSANVYLLALYWKIGKTILENQQSKGWGTKIIDRLAKDLRTEFPDMKGIPPRNLKYMQAFADACPEFVQQPAAQLNDNKFLHSPLAKSEAGKTLQQPAAKSKQNLIVQAPLAQLEENSIMQAPLAQITWYHHIALLDKVKNKEERLFTCSKQLNMAEAAT